jgi:hypothetical protein
MLLRVACECGNTYLVGEDEAGASMTCPACHRKLAVPRPPSPSQDEAPARREGLFWQDRDDLRPDPTLPEEREYQRSRTPEERARREAARRPLRVRLWGLAALAAGAVLVLPTDLIAKNMAPPPWPFRRAYGGLALPSFVLLYKGWVEVVTGIRCSEMLKLATDPTLGWREFLAWLFLVGSVPPVFAALWGLWLVVERLVGP